MAYKCMMCGGVDIVVRKYCWVYATDPDNPDEMGEVEQVDWECDDYEFFCNTCNGSASVDEEIGGVEIVSISAEEYREIVARKEPVA